MNSDSETWIIDAGDTIIRQRAPRGEAGLTRLDRLVYCLWLADYGMSNAGDLATAYDLLGSFHEEGSLLSRELGLAIAHAAFALSRADFEQQYFQGLRPFAKSFVPPKHADSLHR